VPRALIVHPGALGDVLLALPALGYLAQLVSGLQRTVAAAPRLAALLTGSGYAESTVPLDDLALGGLFTPEPDPALLRRLGGYDLIVSWFGAGDATYRAHLEGLGPRVVIARAAPPPGATRHASRHLIETLAPLGPLPAGVPAARLGVGDTERGWARDWLAGRGLALQEPVAVHPGAGSPAKTWPGYPALLRRLRAAGVPVVVTTGPADAVVAAWLAAEADLAGVVVAVDPSPRQLVALLAAARAFVGNDSGPTHAAAAVGCPTLALFGPSDPAVWRPLGTRVTVLAGARPGAPDPWSGLTVDRVAAALAATVPGGLYSSSPSPLRVGGVGGEGGPA
jgi:ADP-heptose:LPS heptosyltransferase